MTTGAWIYFVETYSSTQQIVALSTTESEYISTKDVVHALEIRSALAECDMTLKMMGETDVNRDSGLENTTIDSTLLLKGTPLRPPMSSMSWSSRMVATSFTAVAEAARDCRVSIWNVRNICETNGWFRICVGMVIAILMVSSGGPSGISISDDCSQQKETDKSVSRRRQMKRARTPCRIQDPDYCVES